jgi:glycolate dehydrogenase FAD-binding subunit
LRALRTVEPQTESEVAELLKSANQEGSAVIPRSGGTKLHWGNAPARADVSLSLARMNRVLEHAWADLTVTVEAGCTIAELQHTLAERGQRLAVDPLWPEKATVGGVLSTNDTGVLRYRYGGLRDLIIGVTLALADGTLAASGGKVVKNVAGYDLPKLATGAFGTLGVITQATFRLHPSPKNIKNVTANFDSLPDAQRVLLRVLDTQIVPAALQLRVGAGATHLDALFEGTEEGIRAQIETLRQIVRVSEVSADAWKRPETGAKISTLPSRIAETLAGLNGTAMLQATGLGWLDSSNLDSPNLAALGKKVESSGGSLVLMGRRDGMDAWGTPGDTLPLMRAIKQRFDPRGTLNPGVYLGGI